MLLDNILFLLWKLLHIHKVEQYAVDTRYLRVFFDRYVLYLNSYYDVCLLCGNTFKRYRLGVFEIEGE